MKTEKLDKKYSPKEIAESFVFRNKLTIKEKREADLQLKLARTKVREQITPKQALLSRLLQLRYQIEDYTSKGPYDENLSFSYFLREYLKSLDKKKKDFAEDIDIDVTELSQLLNQHRKPSEKIIIRLEIHSNKTIPAIVWYKLLEKEKEHNILTNTVIRRNESKHVKNKLRVNV